MDLETYKALSFSRKLAYKMKHDPFVLILVVAALGLYLALPIIAAIVGFYLYGLGGAAVGLGIFSGIWLHAFAKFGKGR